MDGAGDLSFLTTEGSLREQLDQDVRRLEKVKHRLAQAKSQQEESVEKSPRIYYEHKQASQSPNVSHLPLPAKLDFEIKLSLKSISGRAEHQHSVTAKAFECATIPALMISTQHYFTGCIAKSISRGKQPDFSSFSIVSYSSPGGLPPTFQQVPIDSPLTTSNPYHTIFEKTAVAGNLAQVILIVEWHRAGKSAGVESMLSRRLPSMRTTVMRTPPRRTPAMRTPANLSTGSFVAPGRRNAISIPNPLIPTMNGIRVARFNTVEEEIDASDSHLTL